MHGPSDSLEHESPASTVPVAPRGTTTLILGCMFSGKTTELLRRSADIVPASTLAFKHAIDKRYRADAIVTHDGKTWPATVVASPGDMLTHVRPGVEIVAIDEAHFFDVSLVAVARDLAVRGIDVIITSLDLDSWGRPFAVAQQLRAMADEPILKHTVCARCGGLGDRTQRLTRIIDGHLVGGPESYEPRCRKCWTPPPEVPPQ